MIHEEVLRSMHKKEDKRRLKESFKRAYRNITNVPRAVDRLHLRQCKIGQACRNHQNGARAPADDHVPRREREVAHA